MASQQTGAGKKQRTNSSKKGYSDPILFRHQDCIPNSPKVGLIENCERQTLLGSKNNKGVECHCKAAGDQVELSLKNKSKQQNPSTKKASVKPEKYKDSVLVKTEQSTEAVKISDELTKSRRRRLRKQKLLVSLAPAQPLPTKPTSSPNKGPPPKSVTRPIPIPVSTPTVQHHPSTTRASVSVDNSKAAQKDQRKRPDKSVSSRNKSIKTKTLIDQSKADIFKTLEEKALNSLLQTLAPLANTSPKRDKPSLPPPPPPAVFSFQDKWINNTSHSNVGDNGVFYFGETKQQLEKLTTNSKEDWSSNLLTKPAFAQINSSTALTGFKPPNPENCLSSFKLSSLGNNRLGSVSQLQQPRCETVTKQYLPNEIVNSGRSLPTSGADNPVNDHFSPVQKDLVHLPLHESKPNTNSVNITSITNSSHLGSRESNPFRKSICADKIAEAHLPIGTLATRAELNFCKTSHSSECNQSQTMKPGDTAKSTKTREEVLLEREAKKAAKLAAKAKHKNPKECKEVASKQVSLLTESKSSAVANPGSDKKSTSNEGESQTCDMMQTSQSVIKKEINLEDKQMLSLKSDSQELPSKSKAEIKAERRAKQEAQRAAKASAVNGKSVSKAKNVNQGQEKKEKLKTESINQPSERKSEVAKVSSHPKPKLFIHLYQEKSYLLSSLKLQTENLHPAVIRLGIQYNTRVIAGSNARCVTLLHALKQVVNDYTTPSEKEFSRGLEEELGPVTAYLHQCRPLAVSMTNALRHIKRTLTQLPNSISDVEARRKICDVIDTYIHEQIDVAGKAICNTVKQKIANGDVILTYSCSSLVYKILVDSHNSGTKFRVVVVDGLPWREGKEMLRRLVNKGISCTYVLITAASFIMREASKVLLGAHALLANGYVMSRAGSSQVALLAHCYNVPVLVCCETHKFCERVQTDAFVYNELGELSYDKDNEKSRVVPNLTPLSLAYDVTPPDLVSAVVTELAVLPCTSVPVILRIKPSESVM